MFPEAPGFDPGAQAWKRKVEELLLELEGAQSRAARNTANRLIATSANMKAISAQIAAAEESVAVKSDAGSPPVDITVDVRAEFNSLGLARGIARVSWTYLTETDEEIVDTGSAARFEVWLRQTRAADPLPEDDGEEIPPSPEEDSRRITSTPLQFVEIPDLELDVEYAVKLCPVAADGTPGDFSEEVLFVTPSAIEYDLPTPTAPTLTSDLSMVSVSSDGLAVGGAPLPPQYRETVAEIADSDTGPWTRVVGASARGAGLVATVPGAAGSTVWASLIFRDTLGRESARSEPASITVQSILGADIGTEVISVAHLMANAVTREKIAAGAVGTGEIADFALTAKKFNTNRHLIF